jgi:hypothetical protein
MALSNASASRCFRKTKHRSRTLALRNKPKRREQDSKDLEKSWIDTIEKDNLTEELPHR